MRLLAAIRRFVFGPSGPPPSAASAFSAVRDLELYGHDFEQWNADRPAEKPQLLDAELPWELRNDPDGGVRPESRP